MLSMLLLLAATPQAVEAPARTLGPATAEELIAAGVAPPSFYSRVPGIGVTPRRCRNDVTLTIEPTRRGDGLTWREGDQSVGLYRLLERSIDGCTAPIIVNYRLPGSNAIGREIRREAPPTSGMAPLR